LSYAPALGPENLCNALSGVKLNHPKIAPEFLRNQPPIKKANRAADAKEVGVGNPAEETYCYPNT